MKILALTLLVASFVVTVVACWPDTGSLLSVAGLKFFLWPLSPYLLVALLVGLARKGTAMNAMLVVCVVAAALGTALIINALYLHTDAQGALVVLLVPALQWGMLIVVGLPLLLVLNMART